jgi:pimeloyl-ACP methyl ester carboxylesterase
VVARAAVIVALAVSGALSRSSADGQSAESERFTVVSNGHPLAVWARRPVSPRAAVLLVHGRTWSSRPDFDLQVPGLERSVLASLAARGIAAYAVDLRGYGATPRDPSGWTTPERAAGDVLVTAAWIAGQHAGLPPVALVGWSRGAAVAMLAAQRSPARVSSLVLYAFAYDPDTRFVDGAVPERPPMARNTPESATGDFVSPKVTPPAVIHAFREQALQSDPILADWRREAEFNALDPRQITMPVLLLLGDRDPGVIREELARFYRRLGADDKQLVLLPGADHAAHIEDTHDAWIDAVVERVLGR